MDALDDMFRGVRAQGSLFGSSTLSPPYALRFVDGAPLTLCTVVGGASWILPEAGAAQPLREGEVLVVRGPAPFTVVDEPGTSAESIAYGERCAVPEHGGTVHRRGWRDPATVAASGEPTTLITAAYPSTGEIARQLVDALPAVLRVGSPDTRDPVLEHLAAEAAGDRPGQQVVLDRLLDWLLVCSIREWFDRPGGTPPGWYSAHADPVVGDALRLLHAAPAAPWTVSSLARRTAVSRATLAKRFTDLVGEPPLTYLTRWRMTLAADLLLEKERATIDDVARTVGYSDGFGFSAAFKRTRGVSPSRYRRLGREAPLPHDRYTEVY